MIANLLNLVTEARKQADAKLRSILRNAKGPAMYDFTGAGKQILQLLPVAGWTFEDFEREWQKLVDAETENTSARYVPRTLNVLAIQTREKRGYREGDDPEAVGHARMVEHVEIEADQPAGGASGIVYPAQFLKGTVELPIGPDDILVRHPKQLEAEFKLLSRAVDVYHGREPNSLESRTKLIYNFVGPGLWGRIFDNGAMHRGNQVAEGLARRVPTWKVLAAMAGAEAELKRMPGRLTRAEALYAQLGILCPSSLVQRFDTGDALAGPKTVLNT